MASTSRTWLVPMPKAMAPNAPCVLVWLSPQAIVMPGLRQAQLRADDVHDALMAAGAIEETDAELAAVALDRAHHRLGLFVGERARLGVRRDDVIDGREGALRKQHLQAELAQHLERLRAGHLVDEVQADEELRLAARQLATVCASHTLSSSVFAIGIPLSETPDCSADLRSRRAGSVCLEGRRASAIC